MKSKIRCTQALSRVRPFEILWTVALQDPLPTVFSGQEYWSEWPFPPSQDVPNTGMEPESPTLAAELFTDEPPGKS